MSTPAIRVSNLSKQFQIGSLASRFDYYTLREVIVNRLSAPFHRSTDRASQKSNIWALKDINFEVPRGQVVGIIGHNGAGKSTLLKVLSRIAEPTTGRIELRGRLASLLEVGTGFHPELSGRENVFLSAAISGMSRSETTRRFDEIVAFAEVDKFIDMPVKRYSTGMYMRLAFAVAAHQQPDILIIDEVLSVGDAAFQKKCLGKMEQVGSSGRTVLFVSHNMGMVNALCDRAILLKAGQVIEDGDTSSVIRRYVQTLETHDGIDGELYLPEEPNLAIQITCARLLDSEGNPCSRFDVMSPIRLEVTLNVRQAIPGLLAAFAVYKNGETVFASWDTDTQPDRLHVRSTGINKEIVTIPAPLIKAGRYQLKFWTAVANVRVVHNPAVLLPFDIVEDTIDASLLSYAGREAGYLALPLDWVHAGTGVSTAD